MTIVPDDQGLLLSVRVTPEQIDSVHPGQISVITFPGLDARSAQELEARVMTISPDVIQDALSGQRYYAVDLAFDEAGRAAVLGGIADPRHARGRPTSRPGPGHRPPICCDRWPISSAPRFGEA